MEAPAVRPYVGVNMRWMWSCALLWLILAASGSPLRAQQTADAPTEPEAVAAAAPAATIDAASSAGTDASVALAATSSSSSDSSGAAASAAPADQDTTVAAESNSAGESSPSSGESSSAAAPDPQDPGTQPAPGEVGPVVNHQVVDEHFFSDFLGDFLHDQEHIWTGPFQPHNYDSHTALHYGIPFIIISGVLIGTDNATAKWLPGSRSGLDHFGTVYSDVFSPESLAAYAGIWYVVGRVTHNEHTRETGFLSLESIADAEVIAGVLKVVTWRARPSGPDTQLAGFWHGGFSSASGGLSMPSGHTIAAFAMATVFAREYSTHHRILAPLLAYSVASMVGFARLSAHEHWYSDVFVGSSLGFLTGRYVYINHHDTDLPGAIPVRHTSRAAKLRPTLDFGSQGPGLYWYF